MNKRILQGVLLPTSFMAPALLAQAQQAADKRMNIVHIMTDDHAFQAISAYGDQLSRQAPTPNLDRLASRGILFRNAYVENSLSTPSRACLMTGLYSHQNGQTMLDNVLDTSVTFVPELLQQNGYQTGMIGKWHMLCEPRGFDYYRIFNGQGEYYNPGWKSADTNGQYVPEEGYATELVTKHAIEFLDSRDPNKPFCLYVHHKAPHRTWMPPLKYLDLYEDIEFPMPPTFYDDYVHRGLAAHDQRMSIDKDMSMVYDLKLYGYQGELSHELDQWGLDMLGRMTPEQRKVWDDSYAKKNEWMLTHINDLSHDEIVRWKYQRYVKDYLRVIKSVDDSVGELLDYLERNNLMDNTIVVYTSDQGFYMGEHGWFDKRFMYEQSFRTPLIISYPGCKGGSESSTLVQNIDFAPTYLAAAGVKQPDNMYGLSLLPLLQLNGQQPSQWRDYLYYHFYDHTAEHNVMRHDGVFDQRYKLIHFYDETGKQSAYDEFYDLQADPDEMYNAINDKRYELQVSTLKQQLNTMRQELKVQEY